ncbi:hypothetical protein [Halobacillus litoralis]|uniref:hypothetical protein n=1 Tax=Halobacillus litoralis TaxID=45668 RepID=UPI001CD5FEB4|nr:hypothetical protein [Halobacillus litoralis]MCA1024287.1 hypothetical protein [Halobacillus litoralis]
MKASGVVPVDTAAVGGQDAATIRHLVEYSANVGALDASIRRPISGALDLETLRVADLLPKVKSPTAVASHDTAHDVQKATERTGHKRVLVMAEDEGTSGILHVRDTLLEPSERPVRELARPALVLHPSTLLHEALTNM